MLSVGRHLFSHETQNHPQHKARLATHIYIYACMYLYIYIYIYIIAKYLGINNYTIALVVTPLPPSEAALDRKRRKLVADSGVAEELTDI